MPQQLQDAVSLLEGLERAGMKAVLVSTGGGSPAIPHLLSTPGASAVVIEALCPYAREAVDRLLGGPQETYCSPRTARRLAAAAWLRGCSLGVPPDRVIGAAVTAALRTRTPKRGPHRIVAATQTLGSTSVAWLALRKEARTRAEEEAVAAAVLLMRLADAAGLPAAEGGGPILLGDERPQFDASVAPASWQDLFVGGRVFVRAAADTSRPRPAGGRMPVSPVPGMLVFPGSFDPLHEGHLRMASLAEEIAERPVEFELSITNVDKPVLDYVEMRDRAAQFTGRSLWFTRAATFLEKLDIFPQGTFVMGADTFARLGDPKYYGGSADAAARAAERIASQARGLIVFGRERDGVFEDPSRLDVPQALREVAYFVSQREFRLDISSTELRRRTAGPEAEPGEA